MHKSATKERKYYSEKVAVITFEWPINGPGVNPIENDEYIK